MAKWSPDHPGQSGHIHISLKDLNGEAVFHDDKQTGNMSKTMRRFYCWTTRTDAQNC